MERDYICYVWIIFQNSRTIITQISLLGHIGYIVFERAPRNKYKPIYLIVGDDVPGFYCFISPIVISIIIAYNSKGDAVNNAVEKIRIGVSNLSAL